jgi:transcriptional regulator with XRE-family HTH domain
MERIVQNGQLRTHRQLRGWSQDDLVRELVGLGIELGERQLGVSASLISRWEHGVTQPRPPSPKLLCQLFNATAEELGLVSPAPATGLLGQAAGGSSHVPSAGVWVDSLRRLVGIRSRSAIAPRPLGWPTSTAATRLPSTERSPDGFLRSWSRWTPWWLKAPRLAGGTR